jgi:hypothetical protein
MGTTQKPLTKAAVQATAALIEALRVLRTTRQAESVQQALRAQIQRTLDGHAELPTHLAQALVACGDRALLEQARAHYDATGMAKTLTSITLDGSHWSGLMEQGLDHVFHLLDTQDKRPMVSARNASLAALHWVVQHPEDPEGQRLLGVLARRDRKAYFALDPRASGLFSQAERAQVGAGFLAQWVVHHTSVARELGKNWAGKGNAFGVMALHLAGLPLVDMQSWNRIFHPAVAPVFGPSSAHHQLALRSHARDLAHLLEHRKAFEDWAASLSPQQPTTRRR